ncbi:Por secretion system C-terminal sorting domain-containing protein [Mariniphaga anaerophila]|uniref:Por secretion system C-terminal sorting domain-containing protein n=1 Tax=Mariniphaga anaerophila TaxID=1484053 RepID=A0A1M4V9H0_9BACT|nr:T9SS type A sorting domain-containing protein [Mariniphaga anaerophila]SHE65498.1 Por secretion system C-terminal sorting domain-containing protein [Mariniphaga anaerophila]
MTTKHILFFVLGMLMSGILFGQIQFWSDDFEAPGSPSSGVRTPSNNIGLGDPSSMYFKRTTNSEINLSFDFYTGQSGSYFWAGENHGGLFGAGNEEQNIVFSSIDISGKTGLTFKGLFAANNQGAAFENQLLGHSHSDYIIVEYSIDGGAYQSFLRFFSNNNTSSGVDNKTLAEDTNGDGIGDGALLTKNFTTFTKAIAGTGTTLTLRVLCFSNAGNEEMALDNFQLLADACVPPVVTANPQDRSICYNGNTTFEISATGATAYQWQVDAGGGFANVSDGGTYSGVTTSTLTITGASVAMTGYNYRCVAINETADCSANSNGATLSVSNINVSGSKSDATCNGAANGAAGVTPSGGVAPYSYSWSPSGGTGNTATGLAAGTYTVTVTDNIGCIATRSFTIEQPAALTVTADDQTNVSCNGGSDGAASVLVSGGTADYTYDWTGTPTGDGTASVTGLSAGTWTCTVTDASGCTASIDVIITEPDAITVTADDQTNVSCNGGSDGSASVLVSGGEGTYTYDWTGTPAGDGTASVTGLSAGIWTCTVTDANGCTASVDFIITEPAALTVTADDQTNVSCNGGSDGSASVLVSGGEGTYTYDWIGTPTGDGTASVTGLSAGTWTCTVTDANGCTASVDFTITEPVALMVTADDQTNVSCNGGSDGAASVLVSGGTADYTYDWTGTPTGDGTASVTGLSAGTWTCTVTDANGCTASVDFIITELSGFSVTADDQTNVLCNGGSNGVASVSVSGGEGPFTYDWTPGNPAGDGTASVTGLSAGLWTCMVTDINGCIATVDINITAPTALVLVVDEQTNVSCNGGADGAASVFNATGGVGGYRYNWTPGTPEGDRTNSATGLEAGTWTCIVTDANNCSSTVRFYITEPDAITSYIMETACESYTLNGETYNATGVYTQNLTASNGCDSTLVIDLTILNSTTSTIVETACDSYSLNGETYTESGIYTQTVPNAVLCDSIITIDLTINKSYFESETVEACDSYTWSDGKVYTSSGTYIQNLTTENGCDSTQQLILTIAEKPVSTVSSTDGITLLAEADAESYQWINCATNEPIEGENSNIFVANENGEYAVVVSNKSGCADTSECFIVTTVGINENKIAETLVHLFPNPTKGLVTLELTEISESDVSVFNMRGKLVLSLPRVQSGYEIDLSSFEPGVYFVKGTHKRGTWTKQIVKM